jgi:hypothetical protein
VLFAELALAKDNFRDSLLTDCDFNHSIRSSTENLATRREEREPGLREELVARLEHLTDDLRVLCSFLYSGWCMTRATIRRRQRRSIWCVVTAR